MVELCFRDRNKFPVFKRVALLAVLPEAALVFIFMASIAGPRCAEECAVNILGHQNRPFRDDNVLRRVAAPAIQSCVFSLE